MPLPILLLRKRKLRHSLGKPSRSDFVQYEVIEEMAKFLDKDQRTAVHYIFNKIPKKKYYEICCKYLKENLSESNRKTEIEKGLRAWLAFLLWHGYSSEYI